MNRGLEVIKNEIELVRRQLLDEDQKIIALKEKAEIAKDKLAFLLQLQYKAEENGGNVT